MLVRKLVANTVHSSLEKEFQKAGKIEARKGIMKNRQIKYSLYLVSALIVLKDCCNIVTAGRM